MSKHKIQNDSNTNLPESNFGVEKMLKMILAGQDKIIFDQKKISEALSRIEFTLVDHGDRLTALEKFIADFAKGSVQQFTKINDQLVNLRDDMDLISDELKLIKIQLKGLDNRVLHLENSQMQIVKDVEEIRRHVAESKNFAKEIVQLDKRLAKLEAKVVKLESKK